MSLNPSQQQAVAHSGGHLLIVAGPGTGKTHTLTQRIISFVPQLRPKEKILAVTFTNKAALEMKHRLAQQNGDDSRVVVGTFHSFCLQFLKQYHNDIGIPADFRVAMPEEIETLTKELWPASSLAQRQETLHKIARWKSVEFLHPIPHAAEMYNSFLRQHKLLDFDDLISESLKLLSFNAQVQGEIQTVYHYVFVDEYQDINPLQHSFLKALVGEHTQLTAIGDPNQAIYGFRGSDVKFFESFTKDFPGAIRLSLQDNYRSAPNLLSASGQVIAKSKFSYVSALTAQIYEQGHLVIYDAPTDKAEAEYVVHEIEKMVGGTSMFSHDSARVENTAAANRSFGDISVLYRLNSQKNVLKQAFERSGIPYEVSGERPLKAEFLPQLDDKYQERSERVRLMTLHASKGLEFPVVFIVGCEESLLPLNIEGLKSDADEERRLFYVGMTRAKYQLYLLRANKRLLYGKSLQNPASLFLADIEEELKSYDKIKVLKKRKDVQLELFKGS